MSKYIAVLILILAMLVAGCAAPASSTDEPAAPAEEPAAPVEEPAAPAEEPAEKVTLTIESWRNDDLAIWQDLIIPAFNKQYPNIEVIFAPRRRLNTTAS